MANFTASICLSDIPKEFIQKGKNGKSYLNVYIGQRKQPSQYGNTHFIKVNVPRDRRVEGVDYYIGDAKQLDYPQEQSSITASAQAYMHEREEMIQPKPQPQAPIQGTIGYGDNDDDLPF